MKTSSLSCANAMGQPHCLPHLRRTGKAGPLISVVITKLALGALLFTLPMLSGTAQTYPEITSLDKVDEQSLSRPGYLKTAKEPTYGTYITRIGDQKGLNSTQRELAHFYAKQQPWNRDGSKILLMGNPGILLDGETYKKIGELTVPRRELITWSNTDPNILFASQNPNKFSKIDVNSGKVTVLRTFSEFDKVSYGNYQGQMSNDDRFVALQAKKGNTTMIFVYDLVSDKIVSRYDGAGRFPKNVAMSQSGKYVIVMWGIDDKSGERKGITVHRASDMKYLRSIYRRQKHADFCYDTNGNEVIVGAFDGKLQMVRLDNGKKTVLLPGVSNMFSEHISCRNIDQKGWATYSHFMGDSSDKQAYQTFYREIFAVRLDGSGKVRRYSHSYASKVKEYPRDPWAVPNHDGSKIMFRSDWGDGSKNAPIYSYVVQASATNTLPERPLPSQPPASPKPDPDDSPSPTTPVETPVAISDLPEVFVLQNKASGQLIRPQDCGYAQDETVPLVSTSSRNTDSCSHFTLDAADSGYYYLRNIETGSHYRGYQCENATDQSVAVMQVNPGKRGACTQWEVVPAGDGFVRLKNRSSNAFVRVFECAATGSDDDALVQVPLSYQGDCTAFTLRDINDLSDASFPKNVRMQDVFTGRTVQAKGKNEGSIVISGAANDQWDSQIWEFETVEGEDNAYRIKNRWSKYYLSTTSTKTWSKVVLSNLNPSWYSQIWYAQPDGDGYRFVNKWSGLYLFSAKSEGNAFLQTQNKSDSALYRIEAL